jgi:hypothetical protein
MRCQSGQHEWTNSLDAARCCDPEWKREWRRRDNQADLDPAGRNPVLQDGVIVIYGWVKVEPLMP